MPRSRRGKYKGPLHGIPWGAKDIIAVKGYKTTWGSPAFKDQMFDYDASVVEMLRDAGAVLIAKLTTGELAAATTGSADKPRARGIRRKDRADRRPVRRSATAAGCVGFGIGTETSGSILSPAARCGLAGLRPTFGRISRYGVHGAVVDAGSARADVPIRRGLRDRDAGRREARRPRHERLGHAIQLERAARRARSFASATSRSRSTRSRTRRSKRTRSRCSTRCARSACAKFMPMTIPRVHDDTRRDQRRVGGVLRRASRAPAA